MKKILVVDDHKEVVDLLEIILNEYEVIRAARGEEAIRCAVIDKPDLVILDIHLVGSVLTGLHTLNILKQTLPHLPIIALSGDPGVQETALKLGANIFIPKPYSPLDLQDKIKELLA